MCARKMYSKVVWPGFSNRPLPRHIAKIGRNEPCPCDSGKKYKDCHLSEGTAYLRKLARQRDKEKAKEIRANLKAQGVPWYKRIWIRR